MSATLNAKNQISRCGALMSVKAQNKIQGMTGVVPGEKRRRTVHTACADGNHRVPNVNRNSDGDWKFNLGNFENDWNDDNCLICFCHSFDSLAFIWREFFLANFFSSRQACGQFHLSGGLIHRKSHG